MDDSVTWHSQIDQIVKKSVSWPGISEAVYRLSTAVDPNYHVQCPCCPIFRLSKSSMGLYRIKPIRETSGATKLGCSYNNKFWLYDAIFLVTTCTTLARMRLKKSVLNSYRLPCIIIIFCFAFVNFVRKHRKFTPITWGAPLIISLFPDHPLRPEN